MTSIAKITALFPHEHLLATHAPGAEPTYETLMPVITQLNANAASIPSSGGDGILGHLVLTIGTNAYTAISQGNVPFVPPVNPGEYDPPVAGTAAARADARSIHDDHAEKHTTYYGTDSCLKQQLLACTANIHTKSLEHRVYGYARVTTRELIVHLQTAYGRITVNDLSANDERMCVPWNDTEPIENLFEQVDDGAAYAEAGGEPYTDLQLVRMAYKNVNATDRLHLACRDWRAKPDADKTWQNFKIEFKIAHLDARESATSGNHGYSANFASYTAEEEAIYAANEAANEAYHANLANTQSDTNAQITALTAQVTLLTQMVQAKGTTPSMPPTKRNPAGNSKKRQADLNTKCNQEKRYCWSHGVMIAENHSSATCENTLPGHVKTATYDNRQGGKSNGSSK